MTFTRITSATGSGYRSSTRPHLSVDGNKVVFQSNSDFFNQGIPEGSREIWLFDTATMTLTRITTTTDSASNGAPSINADGSKIVFHSNSDFLGEGIPIERTEIWLYDTTTMTLTRITTSTAPPPVSFRQSVNPWISGDGTKIVFSSNADFFNPDLSTDQTGIWLYDTETMTFTLVVSAASNGDRQIDYPRTNMDGTRTAFISDFDLLGQGNIQEDQFEIWLASRENEPPRVYLPVLWKKE
jgi:Tol biopolymer transport system component